MLIVRSPVRISFAGGGTDLPAYYEAYGGAVLSTAINKHFYTVLQRRTDGKIQVISSDLRAVETWEDLKKTNVSDSELEIPLCVLKELGVEVSINLFMASEIPPGTGLGSSASVCVNVLKTMAAYLKLPLSKYEIAERAFYIAREILHKHVGKQDEYAAAFGGLNFIEFHPDNSVTVQPLGLSPSALREFQSRLLLFFTGAAHHSWTILKEQEDSTRRDSGVALSSLHAIRRYADKMREALTKLDFDRVGALLHEGWEAKKQVSQRISTGRIDELYEAARRSGAAGGKITGAGGGGFLLLFCRPEHQPKLRNTLSEMGAREMTFDFDLQGAQVIADDPFIDGDTRCGTNWVFSPITEPGLSFLSAASKR
jgi:D-glycero-alpha-D-manno-heptose-7-phosphate kinase